MSFFRAYLVTILKTLLDCTYFEKGTPSTRSIWLKADYLCYDRRDSIVISVKSNFPRAVGINCDVW